MIVVHNDGLLPVVVNSANLTFNDDGTAPFIEPPAALGGIGDSLPKRLEPGEEATLYLDSLPRVAQAHREHGGAKWVTATLAGGRQYHGKKIKRGWLDSWVPK